MERRNFLGSVFVAAAAVFRAPSLRMDALSEIDWDAYFSAADRVLWFGTRIYSIGYDAETGEELTASTDVTSIEDQAILTVTWHCSQKWEIYARHEAALNRFHASLMKRFEAITETRLHAPNVLCSGRPCFCITLNPNGKYYGIPSRLQSMKVLS